MVRQQGAPGSNCIHTIESGDTLWDIATLYFGDGAQWSQISTANGNVQPASLQIGQKLTITAGGAAVNSTIFATAPTPSSWSADEAVKWESELQAQLSNEKCGHCGSNKITRSMRGRPYMAYVDWHKKRSAELGWTTLTLAGCTSPSAKTCAACGQDPSVGPNNASSPPPRPRGGSKPGGFGSIVSKHMFDNELFPNRTRFYTYEGLLQSTLKYSAFCSAGSAEDCKREAAAFLANIAHESGDLQHVNELNKSVWGHYCQTNCPHAQGKTYHGRGPIQLSWNYNYHACGKALGIDLVNNPDLVATDPSVSFATALWFWMTEQPPKPSCHFAIRSSGFGQTINVINGGIECGKGYVTPQQKSRIDRYQRLCVKFGVTPGENLSC